MGQLPISRKEKEAEFDGARISDIALNSAAALERILSGESLFSGECGESWTPDKEQADRLKLAIKLLLNFSLNIETLENSISGLRINQIQALNDVKTFLQNCGYGQLRGYIQQPTGAGKTVLFGLLAKLFDGKTLILVPKKNLLYQTKKELIKTLGFAPEDIGIVGDGTKEVGRKITVATYQSHTSQMKNRQMKLPALTHGVSRLRRSFATIQAALVRNLLVPAFEHNFVQQLH